ncbi:MAG: hypothetical protein AAB599_01510 [Patescibacteria group bacterium]
MSRRESITEKRKTRHGLLLIFASIGLLLLFVFVGTKYLANVASYAVASYAERFKKENEISTEDKTPPGPPRLDTDVPKYTDKNTLSLEGFAESGSIVKIYLNGRVVGETQVSEESKYSLDILLEKGENDIWAAATDIAGNEGEQSPTRRVVFDNESPIIEVSEPKEGETVAEKFLRIKGKTEVGAQIRANERLGVVDQEGNFDVKYTLVEGENRIVLTAVDLAENKSEKTLMISFTP